MKRMTWRMCLAAVATCLLGAPAMAEEVESAPATIHELQSRLDQQAAEIQQLRMLLDRPQINTISRTVDGNVESRLTALEELLDSSCCDSECLGEGENTHGEKFSVKVGGRIQYDTAYISAEQGASTAHYHGNEFRRVRLFAKGKGYGIFDYKLQLDFADGESGPNFRDVYIGAQLPIGHLRVGHFKEPFSLEEQTSSKYITFLERSRPNHLVSPGRSSGIMLSDVWGGDDCCEEALNTWAVGVFYDDRFAGAEDDFGENGETEDNVDQDRSVAGRITAVPYYCADGRYLVHLGAAARYAENGQNQTVSFSDDYENHLTPTDLSVSIAGIDSWTQVGLEAAVVWGSLSVQGEYITSRTDTLNGLDPEINGGYVFVSYFLTGEHRPYRGGSFGRVKPHENFWWVDSCDDNCRFGMGAIELAARYSTVDLTDAGITGQPADIDAYTLGVNWYWNPYMRLMFNYVHTDIDPVVGADAEVDAFLMRWQIDF